jgi:hypothetical protein
MEYTPIPNSKSIKKYDYDSISFFFFIFTQASICGLPFTGEASSLAVRQDASPVAVLITIIPPFKNGALSTGFPDNKGAQIMERKKEMAPSDFHAKIALLLRFVNLYIL